MVVTHLHHEVDGLAERDDQARRLVDWLEGTDPSVVRVVVGDFNAHPDEPAVATMVAAGYRSAFAEANGTEPAVTWPSGIQAEGMDTDGDPACLDYVWVWGDVRVAAARLEFDRPHPEDPTLYPSDHIGISAHLEFVGPRGRAGR
jgi:endonuclease/exonuclease/phosphatase family metal-dependent hydrolase